MSDALDYLMKLRPDVMGTYFSFIKKSGAHLDEKTRAIISVITKVERQTERGFRQYLKRALQAGATANEIIDALFVAFPTLGLSKIVWAVDILLEMDLPEFRPDNMLVKASWHRVVEVAALQPGGNFIADCDGRDLFVYHAAVETRVYDATCPHQGTRIPATGLAGSQLTCPAHGWKFELQSGRCVEKGDQPLRVLQAKIEHGVLAACW